MTDQRAANTPEQNGLSDFLTFSINDGTQVKFTHPNMRGVPLGGGLIIVASDKDSIFLGYPTQVQDGINRKKYPEDFPENHHIVWHATLGEESYFANTGSLNITFRENLFYAEGTFEFQTKDRKDTITGSFKVTRNGE